MVLLYTPHYCQAYIRTVSKMTRAKTPLKPSSELLGYYQILKVIVIGLKFIVNCSPMCNLPSLLDVHIYDG